MIKNRLLGCCSSIALGCMPASAQFVITPGTNAAGVSAQCPFGTGLGDQCGVSPGRFYAPAVGAIGSPPQPTTKPTAAQWQAYAATSGQVWHAAHAQTWNLAGVDYGVGPSIPLSSMLDVAGWNTAIYTGSTTYPTATGCVYLAGTGATGTFTGYSVLGALTVTAGTAAIGEQITGTGIGTNTYIMAGSGSSFTLNQVLSFASSGSPETVTYFDTYQGSSWPAGEPVLLCSGKNTSPSFNIIGWNFGPTAYQIGTPIGSHDCINLLWSTYGAGYAPTILVENDAFINGSTCSPNIGGTRYGMVSNQSTNFQAILTFNNNYVWGRNTDPCCLPSSANQNQGLWLSIGKLQQNITSNFNWIYQLNNQAWFVGWTTGNEQNVAACSNGATYSYPGYMATEDSNYVDNYGALYGAGHFETANLGGQQSMCLVDRSWNTIVSPSAMANSTLGPFFGWASSGTGGGSVELSKIVNNTSVVDITGGRKITDPHWTGFAEFYDWHTDGASPVNHIIIDGTGSSCGSQCVGPVNGQGISGGTNNTTNAVVGLQNNLGTGPITGSLFNAGCNSQDNASTGICQFNGNYPSLNPAGIVFPINAQPKVLNSAFASNVASVALFEYDHGADTYQTTTAVSSATNTVTTALGSCVNGYQNAILKDTTQSTTIGMITGTGCTVSGTAVFTLYTPNIATSVAGSDNLTIVGFAYGTTLVQNNYMDITGSLNYMNMSPAVSGGTGFQSGTNGGGCAVAATLTGNIDLVSGAAANFFGASGGAC